MGNEFATMDTVLPEKDLHVSGTVQGPGGKLTFWLTVPRPRGMSVEEWEAIQQEKWARAFKGGT